MSANIRVVSGISAGTLFWIERAVVRIGSDPGCDVCLPSVALAKHAVTLEFRDGKYLVHNRTPQPLGLDGTNVPAGGRAAWVPGQPLRVSNDAELLLEIVGDPAPSPRPADFGLEEYDEEPDDLLAESEAADGKQRDSGETAKTVFQLAVIVFCVIGIVVLLIYDSRKSTPVEAVDVPPFAEIVAQGLAEPDAQRLLQRLQVAEAAVVRGNEALARQRFASLRDDLLPQQGATPDARSDFVENAYKHVLLRLSEVD